MSTRRSITTWLDKLKTDEERALAMLFRRVWPALERCARGQFGDATRRADDEEDAAQEAFAAFVQSWRQGKFPRLENRGQLFAILFDITRKKVGHAKERGHRLKRGAGRVCGESGFGCRSEGGSQPAGIEAVADASRGPAERALAGDTYRHFMGHLPPELRPVGEAWAAGHSAAEIAEKLGVSHRTINRDIRKCLDIWRDVARQCLEDDD